MPIIRIPARYETPGWPEVASRVCSDRALHVKSLEYTARHGAGSEYRIEVEALPVQSGDATYAERFVWSLQLDFEERLQASAMKQASTEPAPTNVPVLSYAISSRDHLVRFLGLFGAGFVACAAIVGIVAILINHYAARGRLRYEFQDGRQRITVGPDEEILSFLLPSSAPQWIDSGARLRPGQRAVVSVSGRVHTAIHRLVEAGNYDVRPELPWTGPLGTSFARPVNDQLRKALRVCPDAHQVAVLAYLRETGERGPNEYMPLGKRPDARMYDGIVFPTDAADLGQPVDPSLDSVTFLIEPPKPDREYQLWFILNDTLLYPEAHDAYMGACNSGVSPSCSGYKKEEGAEWRVVTGTEEALKLREEGWSERIAGGSAPYWEMWFDDNVGDLLVQVHLTSESVEPSAYRDVQRCTRPVLPAK